MKQVLSILTLIIILCSCNNRATEKKKIDESVLGTYKKGYKDMGTNLILNSEGKFINQKYRYSDYVQEGEPSGWITNTIGHFETDSNKVILYPDYIVEKELYDNKAKLIDSLEYYKSDSISINTEFTVIKWNSNIYLLSELQNFRFGYRTDNDIVRFAGNYNTGSEPRWNESYFAQRNNKERFEKIDLIHVPLEWRHYFLDSPIKVIVKEVEKNFFYDSMFMNYINRYKLIGGVNNNVNEGMTFFGDNGCCILKIMETFDSTSYGIIELCPKQQNSCKVGDTLSTRNERDNGKYVP